MRCCSLRPAPTTSVHARRHVRSASSTPNASTSLCSGMRSPYGRPLCTCLRPTPNASTCLRPRMWRPYGRPLCAWLCPTPNASTCLRPRMWSPNGSALRTGLRPASTCPHGRSSLLSAHANVRPAAATLRCCALRPTPTASVHDGRPVRGRCPSPASIRPGLPGRLQFRLRASLYPGLLQQKVNGLLYIFC